MLSHGIILQPTSLQLRTNSNHRPGERRRKATRQRQKQAFMMRISQLQGSKTSCPMKTGQLMRPALTTTKLFLSMMISINTTLSWKTILARRRPPQATSQASNGSSSSIIRFLTRPNRSSLTNSLNKRKSKSSTNRSSATQGSGLKSRRKTCAVSLAKTNLTNYTPC